MIKQIEPWVNGEELKQLERVVESTYLTEADLTLEFEHITKIYTGAKYCVAMANGTAAIFCALKALGIGAGDEVIVPDLTFVASSNAVIMAGAKPIFCDIYEDTFCIDLEKAEELINNNTKAILPVHLYGQSVDMEKIMDISNKYSIKIIEDAAQGVGVKFSGKHVGTFGDIGILSYYGNKTITCGEGGMILTNSKILAEKCYRLKNHGRTEKGIFVHDYIGYNFSFTEMQAAIGIAQMGKLKEIIKKKKYIHDYYVNELSNCSMISPCYVDNRSTPVYWLTSFSAENKDNLVDHLKENGIQTRSFFLPLHLQPCYSDLNTKENIYPVSEEVYLNGISLPSSYSLEEHQLQYITDKIKSYYS